MGSAANTTNEGHSESHSGGRRFYEKYGNAYAVFSGDQHFYGTIIGFENKQQNIRVEGKFSGDINLPRGVVIVSEGGSVEGNITASCIVVDGRCEGALKARDKMELGETARVTGSVSTPHLAVAEGSIFNGEMHSGTGMKQHKFKERRTNRKR